MEWRTLENTAVSEIVRAFNTAFSDYIIPIKWTEAAAIRKFKVDHIDLSISVGCFIEQRLSGFILHGVGQREGQPIVWNGGTGVVPTARGKGITTRLYDFIIPKLINRGFKRTVLEVIVGNDPAIHIYEKNGFEKTRQLICYKGPPSASINPTERIELRALQAFQAHELHSFHSWAPTFQNGDQKIIALQDNAALLGAFEAEKLLGYIAFEQNPEAGDVFQFAVHPEHRRAGIGRTLFREVARRKSVPLKIINVDANHAPSVAFFEKNGFTKIVEQLEMVKLL